MFLKFPVLYLELSMQFQTLMLPLVFLCFCLTVTSAPVEEYHIPSSLHENENKTRFSDLFPGLLPDGNEQFTLLFIKPEVCCSAIHTTCICKYAVEEFI